MLLWFRMLVVEILQDTPGHSKRYVTPLIAMQMHSVLPPPPNIKFSVLVPGNIDFLPAHYCYLIHRRFNAIVSQL